MSAIREYAFKGKDKFVDAVSEACKLACIEMVKRAKSTNTYQDQTHRLRSSIGCVLFRDGAEIFNYFESTGGEMGGEGVSEGLQYARSVAESAGNHLFVAVVVAGADYALYVESKGYDVLTGSSRQFKADLEDNFNDVINAYKDDIISQFGL